MLSYLLPDGKFIIFNNDEYVYIGDSNNQPIKIAMYTDITNIRQAIIGQYSGNSQTSTAETQNIILGFRPSYVFVSVLNRPSSGNTSYIGMTTNQTAYYDAISTNDNGFVVSNINQHYLNLMSYQYAYLAFP